ncbi:PAS domain S-box protein [Sorangium sp. So ce128]|uniref:PAS domain-containing hybrid sensor histidine kinase/response regulator n=1 Tax=Sorangium sp. So ce128 TaxID=3133281 RepID=UPI003F6369B2
MADQAVRPLLCAPSPVPHAALPADGLSGRGQAAGELQLKAALLDRLGDAALAWELGGASAIVYFGAGAEQLYGFPARDALGRSSHDLLRTALPAPLAQIEAALLRDGLWDGEIRRTTRDGREILVESRLRLVEGAERRRIVLETGREITAQRRAEEALRDSEARFRNMADHAPVMIWVTGADGGCTYASRGWLDFSGQTEAAALGFGWIEAVHPEDRSAAMEAFLRANERREDYRIDFRVRRRDGVYRWCIDSAAPRLGPGGEFLGYVGSIIDITERKEAELQLQEREEGLRRAIMATSFPIMIYAEDGHVVCVNSAWTDISGYTREQIPTVMAWLDRAYGARSAAIHARVASLFDMDEASGENELTLTTASGAERTWVFSSARLGRDAAGRRLLVTIAYDITERKRAADAWEATLREADQRKDAFLAMLAHELRNPLGPIRNAVEILRSTGIEQPSLLRACGVIERQVAHMARLVDDLLDVSRVARGRIQLRKERCDLPRLLRQTAEDYRSTLEASGLELRLDLPIEPLWVSGDPTRLSQAVSNVLHNANKFTDAGGRVTVALSATPDGSAVIRVRDTGIGAEPATLARMFEPFSQAERSLDRNRGGLGLGLALVKGLVELHGGTASAESAGVGHGTEIVLRLPLARGPEASPERAAPPPRVDSSSAGAARSLRVLIIEDNEDAAEMLQALLAMNGHQVEVALSGAAGVEAARSFRPEVILCDIGLPGGMDGCGVARTLKALEESADVAPSLMIALTGYGQERDQRRVREAGFDMHFVKPIDPGSLQSLLASVATRA